MLVVTAPHNPRGHGFGVLELCSLMLAIREAANLVHKRECIMNAHFNPLHKNVAGHRQTKKLSFAFAHCSHPTLSIGTQDVSMWPTQVISHIQCSPSTVTPILPTCSVLRKQGRTPYNTKVTLLQLVYGKLPSRYVSGDLENFQLGKVLKEWSLNYALQNTNNVWWGLSLGFTSHECH